MNLQLYNKTALVTGSTAGIGFAIAHALSREGAVVIVNGRSQARVDQAVGRIRADGPAGEVRGFAVNLAGAAGVNQLVQQVPVVDLLVNNLGIYAAKSFQKITDEDWLNIFDVNVMSGVRLSRFYLPKMHKQNHGRIVFISSESGAQIPEEMIHYGVTKTAQIALARGLAETTAGTGITVNSVLAGPTASEGVRGFVSGVARDRGVNEQQVEKEFFQNVRPTSLLKRFASPEEVASLVVYLCSPLASATNGAALRVDGGVVRSIF